MSMFDWISAYAGTTSIIVILGRVPRIHRAIEIVA
jgi:hypothetical protein